MLVSFLLLLELRNTLQQFSELGHDVMSCDFLPSLKQGKHHQGDIMDIINDGWDVGIFFPPCTHLAVSGTAHFEQKRKDGRQQQAIDFFMSLVKAPIDMIAIENPIGIMSTEYRAPDQIVHPYYFGDNYAKSTCLWLKNLPKLTHSQHDTLFYQRTHIDPEYLIYNSSKTKSGKSRYSKFGKLGKGKGMERSVTPQGLANAMSDQWSYYLSEGHQKI